MGEKLFLLACFMLLACFSFATIDLSPNDQNDSSYKSMFILAGQSNMGGRGYDNDNSTYPREYFFSHPQILMFDANQTWKEAADPGLHVGIDKDNLVGIGPGMPFANRISIKDPGFGTIGLIPCARGQTSIMLWMKGTYLYDRLVHRSQVALQGGGEIKALLWYQGESDALHYEDAQLYGSRLAKFLTDVRADLGLPDLPVLVVAMMTGDGEYKMMVRQAQKDVKLPNVVTVDAKGAGIKYDDKLHLNKAGIVEVGKRLADTFLQINEEC